MKFVAYFIPALLLMPVAAFAQSGAGNFRGIRDFIMNIIEFMNDVLVPFIFALAFLAFLWGMFKTFILGGSDPDKQQEGKQLMLYSIAGFVLMVSLWGIVNVVANSFGFRDETIQQIPNLPDQNL